MYIIYLASLVSAVAPVSRRPRRAPARGSTLIADTSVIVAVSSIVEAVPSVIEAVSSVIVAVSSVVVAVSSIVLSRVFGTPLLSLLSNPVTVVERSQGLPGCAPPGRRAPGPRAPSSPPPSRSSQGSGRRRSPAAPWYRARGGCRRLLHHVRGAAEDRRQQVKVYLSRRSGRRRL